MMSDDNSTSHDTSAFPRSTELMSANDTGLLVVGKDNVDKVLAAMDVR